MAKKKTKRKRKKGLPPALKKWQTHLMEYKKTHTGISLKQAMKGASKTYEK